MRWLIRVLCFWSISLLLGYFVGLPYALEVIQARTRSDVFSQCLAQHTPIIGTNPMPAVKARTETYCHCLADDLIFSRSDLMDSIKKRKPAAFGAQIEAKVKTCAEARERAMNNGF